MRCTRQSCARNNVFSGPKVSRLRRSDFMLVLKKNTKAWISVLTMDAATVQTQKRSPAIAAVASRSFSAFRVPQKFRYGTETSIMILTGTGDDHLKLVDMDDVGIEQGVVCRLVPTETL